MAQNQYLNIALDKGLYIAISKLAKENKISLSQITRYFLGEAIECYEDSYWEKVADMREKTLKGKKISSVFAKNAS